MKKLLLSILSAAAVWAAPEKTPVEFTSLSVQIFPSTATDAFGLGWNSALSSFGDENSINDELKLATEAHGFSHEGFFVFENDFTFEPFAMPFVLDVPPFADVDDDGIDDFFDASISVDAIQTLGQHPDGGNNRPVNFTATWTRAAGDSAGSVVLDFPSLGLTFQHSFQLLRFTGTFSFARENNLLQGLLSLTNLFEPQDIITGPLAARVVNSNTLVYSALNWTNQNAAVFTVVTNLDLGRTRTNFVSYWLLEDGYAATGDLDYVDWFMVLSSADANGNGQLDLTEVTTIPGERPTLEIARLANGSLEITMRGTPGQTYTLEFANAITGGTWQISQTITLATGTQAITVTGAGSRRFFRLRQ
jgi:hypothetical protein